jgi:hypothetical protein
MATLFPTAPDQLVDQYGRPYFLWDMQLTLDEFRERLADPDPQVRAYFVAKLMRQAKPDDVFTFVSPVEILAIWPALKAHLGRSRAFWRWLFETWQEQGHDWH